MIKAMAFDFGSTLYQVGPFPEKVKIAKTEIIEKSFDFDRVKSERFRTYLAEAFLDRKNENIKHSHTEYPADYCFMKALDRMEYSLNDFELYPIINSYFKTELDHITPLKETINLIHYLKNKLVSIALVTNNPWHPVIEDVLMRDRIHESFEFIISSSVEGVRKPSPTIFRKLLDKWSRYDPSETLFVGDDLVNDIEPAKKMGMRCQHMVGDISLETIYTLV